MTALWSCGPTDRPWVSNLFCAPVEGRVAEVWWLHEPDHRSVTMTRIVDRLNLPGVECRPSKTPIWSMRPYDEGHPEHEHSIPRAVQAYFLADVEVCEVVWYRYPRNLPELHQRILDALNPGRGLPAVTVPALVRAA